MDFITPCKQPSVVNCHISYRNGWITARVGQLARVLPLVGSIECLCLGKPIFLTYPGLRSGRKILAGQQPTIQAAGRRCGAVDMRWGSDAVEFLFQMHRDEPENFLFHKPTSFSTEINNSTQDKLSETNTGQTQRQMQLIFVSWVLKCPAPTVQSSPPPPS